MAATVIYRHDQVACGGLESDETDKHPSTESVDCNKNLGKKSVDACEKVDQSNSSITEKEVKGNDDGTCQSEKEVSSLLMSPKESVSEKTSKSVCSSSTHNNNNVAEISQEGKSSAGSAGQVQALQRISQDDKSRFECTSSDDSSVENNNKTSYLQIKSKRKTLLKIEKVTDSDNRTRDKMRRRALSPPSSSDEENLYIGWIAYPASITSFRRTGRKPRSLKWAYAMKEIWMKAVKLIFYPVTKVCQKCIRNKVADIEK